MGSWSVVISGVATDFDSLNFTVIAAPGTGKASVENIIEDNGRADGGFHQRTVAKVRTFALVGFLAGTSLDDLHNKRLALINVLKRDRGATDEPVELRYTGNTGITLRIYARYVSGLEYTNAQAWVLENLTIRFQAVDPYFYATSTDSTSLAEQSTFGSTTGVFKRVDGTWSALGTSIAGGTATAYAIARDSAGDYYVGGDFTSAGATSADYLAKYDPDTNTWSVVKTATAFPAIVRALAIAPNGDVYIGGDFASVDGLTQADNIVKYTPGTDTYTALGAVGMNNKVWAVAVGPDGTLYAGGEFTTAGGVTVAQLAKWNGSAWSAVTGAPAAPGVVTALAVDHLSNTLYVGGDNTPGVWAIDLATGTSTAATGFSGTTTAMALNSNGDLYVGNSGSANRVYRYDGANVHSLGTSITAGAVRSLAIDNGILWVGGSFTTAGGLTVGGLAGWDGSNWFHPGVTLPGTPTVYAINAYDGDLYLGFNTSGTAITGSSTSVVNNGSATAYPIITFYNDTASNISLYEITNTTQGSSLRFAPLVVQPEETITIDLAPGEKTITSSWRGNVIGELLRSSTLQTFSLLPGTNSLYAYASASTGETTVTWYKRYWSLDA